MERPAFQEGDKVINTRNEMFGTVLLVEGDEVVGRYDGTTPIGGKLFTEKFDNVARLV